MASAVSAAFQVIQVIQDQAKAVIVASADIVVIVDLVVKLAHQVYQAIVVIQVKLAHKVLVAIVVFQVNQAHQDLADLVV